VPIDIAGMGQEFRDVEADAAGADDRDAAAGDTPALDDVDVARHALVRKSLDRRLSRDDAGREDDRVAFTQVIRGGRRAEPAHDAERREAPVEIAQRLGELFFSRNAPREIELPADRLRGVEQRDLVTAFCGGRQLAVYPPARRARLRR